MARTKEILTAVGALACAIGIGFVMQSSDTAQARYGDQPDQKKFETAPELKGASADNAILDVQEITLTSAEFETDLALPDADIDVTKASATPSAVPKVETPEVLPAPTCDITATGRAVAAAMVDLELSATCLPNERVTVHHNGMIFTETTTAEGTLNIKVPALAVRSVFIFAFRNGEGAVAQVTVEELADYDRAVLQWKGNTGFQIHAREFGADYGSAGHFWQDAPGEVSAAVAGESGMITRHGDADAPEPLLAEVYSFPKHHKGPAGQVALSVETEVTEANCGLEIEAQSLELQPDSVIKTQNLTLPMPDCDAKGSFLVLNNLLQDLKVAGS